MGIIIVVVLILLICCVVIMYNSLVSLKMKVQNSWSQIDVQLQRRFDLIPNFVETVKGYMSHEKETLEKIVELRSSWKELSTLQDKAKADSELSNNINSIMAISENYPDLKANQNFMKLSEELRNTEDKIAYSRQFYNDAVTIYNTKVQVFPSNIIASIFNFKLADLFSVQSSEVKDNVKVNFEK